MAYHREDIERVRAATNLVDLVAEVTKVRKTGRSVSAICPFHQEKTPSMSVDPGRGLYHCFGCGKSGDVYRFVQESQGLGFSESVEFLARRAGITLRVDPEAARRHDRRTQLAEVMEKAVSFYHLRLRTAADAGAARGYLRGRGYDTEVVDGFRLGYSPDSWDALVDHLRAARVSEESMVAAGLAVRSRQGRMVDRFRGRIMFPIFDLRGDAAGFGARLLSGEGPKYLNSPETALYRKSRLLYGLNWAKPNIVRSGFSVVVEGYTDVIAMHSVGLPAVATCGTALGEEHLDLLRRFSERVVLAFDADDAGAAASLRGFERSVPGDLDLRVALLPEGMDPADLVRNGEIDALRKAVEESQPLMQFRIDRELAHFDLSEPEARVRAVRSAAADIARHPDQLVRHEYAVQLSRLTGVELAEVTAVVERSAHAQRVADVEPAPPPARRMTGTEKAEREYLRAMLHNHPGVAEDLVPSSVFSLPEHLAAFDLLAPIVFALGPGEAPDLGTLLGDDPSDVGAMLRALALEDRPLADPAELARKLQVGALERRISETGSRLERLDRAEEPEAYASAFTELITLERQRHELGGQS